MTHKKLPWTSKNQDGFTLAETLIVVFLSGIILVIMLMLYQWHNTTYTYQQAVVRTTDGTRRIAQTLQLYAVQARRVLANKTVAGTDYASGGTSVILEVPSIDASRAVIPNQWDYVVFYADGNKFFLVLEAGPGSSRPSGIKLLTDTLSEVEFTYNSGDFTGVNNINVEAATEVWANNQAVRNNLEQELFLKNY